MSADRLLTILMSDPAREAFGARIHEVMGERPYRLVGLDATSDAMGHYPVDIAFLSRDVTGTSSKTVLTSVLERFYEILRHSPPLTWIQMHSAGADRPIYQEMRDRGVMVTSGSGANAKPVAQMAVAGLLALARCLPAVMDSQRRQAWEPLLGARAPQDLEGQTALVVGWGPIGQEIGRLCKALDMRVVAVRREAVTSPGADEVIRYAELNEHLPHAEWVVLACPLSDTTRGLIQASTLARLPAGARVINVSRGEVIVESDFIRAVESGHLGGAFLDVFEKEPLSPDSPLWSLPNVMISPHSAGHTQGHYQAVGAIFLDNLSKWLTQSTLRNVVQ